VTGGIAAAVKIHGDGGGSFLKDFAAAIGAEHNERDRALNARAAA